MQGMIQNQYGLSKGIKTIETLYKSRKVLLSALNNLIHSESCYKGDENACQILSGGYPEQVEKRPTVLAIHTGANIVSWSLIDDDYQLLTWSYKSFLDVVPDRDHISLVYLASQICQTLPAADKYVLSKLNLRIANMNKSLSQAMTQRHHLYISLLTNIINKAKDEGSSTEERRSVSLVETKNVGKFFGLNIGKEMVASKDVVKNLLSTGYTDESKSIVVKANNDIMSLHSRADGALKEQLNFALLMAVLYKYEHPSIQL